MKLLRREIQQRLARIRNISDLTWGSLVNDSDDYVEQFLADMLRLTWELARDVNPEIVIRAGAAIEPPSRPVPLKKVGE